MTDRPIIFSGAMVRALLAGTKTQTRRLVKWRDVEPGLNLAFSGLTPTKLRTNGTPDGEWRLMSRGAGGCWQERAKLTTPWPRDRLWVRETWAHDGADLDTVRRGVESDGPVHGPYFRATATEFDATSLRWRPAIHMPRWASRLTLTVTDVRVQRLQEISEADAIAEGVRKNPVQDGTWVDYPEGTSAAGWLSPQASFRKLWNTINGQRPGAAWANNPWIVALTFTVETRNIDASTETSPAPRSGCPVGKLKAQRK